MRNCPCMARPDLVRRLVAAGCPLDIEEVAQGNAQASPGDLLISQVNGDLLNTAFDLDGWTVYILDLEIASDVPGLVVIRYIELDPPWPDPQVYLLPDPADSGERRDDEYAIPGTTIVYPRNLVINHRVGAQGKLRRGDILDGLLLGLGFAPIPDCFRHGDMVDARFCIGDQFGRRFPSKVSLWVDRSAKHLPRRPKQPRRGLFQQRDHATV